MRQLAHHGALNGPRWSILSEMKTAKDVAFNRAAL